jgi:hypothetical protein
MCSERNQKQEQSSWNSANNTNRRDRMQEPQEVEVPLVGKIIIGLFGLVVCLIMFKNWWWPGNLVDTLSRDDIESIINKHKLPVVAEPAPLQLTPPQTPQPAPNGGYRMREDVERLRQELNGPLGPAGGMMPNPVQPGFPPSRQPGLDELRNRGLSR